MNRVQCLRTKDMINDYLDGTLESDAKKEMFAHIEQCETCQVYFEDMKAISECMAEDLLEDLPEEFEATLRLKLQAVAVDKIANSSFENVTEFRPMSSKASKGFGVAKYKQYIPTLSAAAVVVLAFGVTMSGMNGFKELAGPDVGNSGGSKVAYDAAVEPTAKMKFGAPVAPTVQETASAPESAPTPAPESAPAPEPKVEAKAMMATAPGADSATGDESVNRARSAVSPTADVSSFTDVTQGKEAQQGHKIIKTGTLNLETVHLDLSIKQLQEVVSKHGGFIENDNVGNVPPVYEADGTVKSGTESLRTAWYHVRIPADQFDTIMDELAAVGKETNRSVSSQDITTQYVDNESQLKNLKAREEALRGLMGKTANVKDLLDVDRELTDVHTQIDSLMSQKKVWDGQISLSAIDVNLNEVKNYTGEISKTPEGVAGVFKKAMVNSINVLLASVIKTFYLVVLVLPYVVLFGVVYFGTNKWLHRKNKTAHVVNQKNLQNMNVQTVTDEVEKKVDDNSDLKEEELTNEKNT